MLISWLWLDNKLAQLFLLLDSALYQAVEWLYGLFMQLAQSELFESAVYENLAQRIYVVLGIVMLFVLAYSLLKAVIDPDSFSKGDKSFSKLAKNLVVSLIIIGLLPTVFDYSRKLQNFILDQNLIGTLLFGSEDMDVELSDGSIVTYSAADIAKSKIDNYGSTMALTSFNAFFNPENYNFEYDASSYLADHGLINPVSVVGCGLGAAAIPVVTFFTGGVATVPSVGTLVALCAGAGAAGNWAANRVVDVKHYTWDEVRLSILADENGGFTQIISLAGVLEDGAKCVGTSGSNCQSGENISVTYMPFISSLCALFLIYLLISFCLDLGIRTVRLAFLQLIAPIPILMRAMPGKSSSFDKWVKKTIATYLEVFIRIFLMYIAIYFLSNLPNNLNSKYGLWVNVVLIMGIIAFVKEAPKLIADITGIDSGNMKLGILPKLAAGGALAGAALVGAGSKSLARNAVHGWGNVTTAFHDQNTHGFQKFRNVTGAVGRGIGSTITGGISGAVRGGYGARGAKNLADVTKSTSASVEAVEKARNYRESYRLEHGKEPGGVGGAQIRGTVRKLGQWAGVDSLKQLLDSNKLIEKVRGERKAVEDTARDTLLGDIKKRGKTSFSYDDGSHTVAHLRKLQDDVEAANGTPAYADAKNQYEIELQYMTEALANRASKGDENWKDEGHDVRADLANVRIAADKYKETLRENINAPFITALKGFTDANGNEIDVARDILDRNKDLNLDHPAYKQIKSEMSLLETENSRKINEERKREAEAKDKK